MHLIQICRNPVLTNNSASCSRLKIRVAWWFELSNYNIMEGIQFPEGKSRPARCDTVSYTILSLRRKAFPNLFLTSQNRAHPLYRALNMLHTVSAEQLFVELRSEGQTYMIQPKGTEVSQTCFENKTKPSPSTTNKTNEQKENKTQNCE